MKITCQSCQAKYTIADEKVAGKTVKIKCKKCGATIVVSGSDGAAAAPVAAPAPMAAPAMGAPMAAAPPGDDDDGEGATRVFSEGAGAAAPDEWTVNVTDDDQRTLTSAQIVMEYQRGTIRADTYVWKDGMADWLPISDVPELMRLVATPRPAANFSAPRPAAGMPAAGAPAPMAAAPVPVEPDLGPGGLGGTVIMHEGSPIGGGPSPAGPAAPTAARRVGKPGGGVDLFASGQHEMAPAAPMASSHDRQVGERNENSVLFSISALTASAGASKRNDDPFDLAAPSPPRHNGRGNVDDIMNLGAGIGGAPMLAPPPLLAPVVEAPPPPPPPQPVAVAAPVAPAMSAVPAMRADQFAPPPAKSKAPLIVGVVVGVLALGGVGAFFAFKPASTPPPGSADATNAVATTTATSAPADKPTLNGAAPTATPTPADTAKPAETAAAQAPTAPTSTPGGSHEAAAHESGHPASGGPAAHESKPEKPADTKPEKPADDKPAKPADDKPAKPADSKPADTGGGSGKEFDRGAAMAALSGASGAARGCKKDDGPTGTAHVRITFAPNGSVTSSSVDGAFAGTSVGACIAAAFKGAHVPAFDGSSVTVTKSISIN